MTTIVPPSSAAASATASATKKTSTPGHPWSHLETTALIDAYESKWYSLNRGQLKAQQWDEVAAAVSARCAVASPAPHHPPPKSGTQCRHKIEKLRKRYRSEKNRPVPSLWPYFDRMERMERGPVPISVKAPSDDDDLASNDDDDDDDNEIGDEYLGNGSGSGSGSGDGVGVLMEVAREVRRMGEGMVRVEKRRMEMMREVERGWMETEAKRTEMVVEAQRGILASIAGAFAAMKKARKTEDL